MRRGMTRAAVTLLMALAWPVAGQTHDARPIEVPLREEGGRLFVPVLAPDGSKLELMLSTGTPPTVLAESVAARIGGMKGLTMAGIPVSSEGALTLPDEQITVDGRVLDGMVGPKTLNQFDVLIDVPGERLLLKPIGRSVSWEGMTMSEPVRVRVMHGTLIGLDVELNGREARGMLDLAMPALIVNEPVKSALNLEDKDVGSLRLGSTTLADLPIAVREDLGTIFQGWDPNSEGFVIVGAAVAMGCAISISWVHREVRTCVR